MVAKNATLSIQTANLATRMRNELSKPKSEPKMLIQFHTQQNTVNCSNPQQIKYTYNQKSNSDDHIQLLMGSLLYQKSLMYYNSVTLEYKDQHTVHTNLTVFKSTSKQSYLFSTLVQAMSK